MNGERLQIIDFTFLLLTVYGASKPRGGGRGRGGRRTGIRTASTQAASPGRGDESTRRVLSARRNKVNELKNQVEDLQRQLAAAQAENKTLRREQHLRDRAIKKYESDENNVANMVSAHNAEVRSLREQLRKAKEKQSKTERHLLDAEDELERGKKNTARLKALVEEKKLGERDELARKLTKAEADFEDTERKLKVSQHGYGNTPAWHDQSQRQLARWLWLLVLLAR